MTPEQELVGVITQVFPSFQAVPPAERAARSEALGLFLVQGWSAGAARLWQSGLEFGPDIVDGLAPAAQRVLQARRGGLTFLVHLRQAVNDDARFQRLALALGALYARSRPASGVNPQSARFKAVTREEAAAAATIPSGSGAVPVVQRPTIVPPVKATASRPAVTAGEIPRSPRKTDELNELDLAPVAKGPATTTSSDESGERTRGFDARMLNDLEETLKDSGDRPTPRGGPSPAAPAPPPPASPVPDTFEEALSSKPISFMDEEAEPATALFEAPVSAPPAAPVAPAAPEPELELAVPADEPPPQAPETAPDQMIDRLLAESKPPPPKVVEEPKPRPSGRFKSTSVRVKEFSLETNDDWMNATTEDSKDDASSEEELPKDPAQAALVKFDRSGDPGALADAKKIFAETLAGAKEGTARAYAEAGLAKIQLLGGNAVQADQQARAALERDPGNPFAVEVIVRVQRGESERSRLASGLAHARTLITQGRAPEARKFLETKLAPEHDASPQPWLLAAYLAKLERDDARFSQTVAQAWQRYPGKKHADLPIGGTIDIELAHLLALHGRARFKALDSAFLKKTVENIDSKENIAAGTFRLAIACARIGMIKGHHSRKTIRKGWIAIGSGLIGLQYYDGAVATLTKAQTLNPDQEEAKSIEHEIRFANQMRRAFDKPGVKAQLSKYACLGVQAISTAARARLAAASKDKAERAAELFKAAEDLAKVVTCDQRVRDEVTKAAAALGKPDPVDPIELVEAELGAVREERARLAAATDPSKSSGERKGFLSKLASAASAAADKVASTAKDAQSKLREVQLVARREEVVKRLGLVLARDLRDHAWLSQQLKIFARRAASLEAFSDYHAEEERQAKADLDALAQLV